MNLMQIALALKPLKDIADAYDRNELDDEARKTWGIMMDIHNTTPPQEIVIYQGRGGTALITLQHCFNAREALKMMGGI